MGPGWFYSGRGPSYLKNIFPNFCCRAFRKPENYLVYRRHVRKPKKKKKKDKHEKTTKVEKIYNYIYLDLFNNYCIHACRLPAVYENFRGFWHWFIEIFWIFAQRASKVDFWCKKVAFFCSGGLIKSGLL